MELAYLNCVDPHKVLQPSREVLPGLCGVPYDPKADAPNATVNMEEFTDLSQLIPRPAVNFFVDELNTPDFERKEFNFTANENTVQYISGDDLFQFNEIQLDTSVNSDKQSFDFTVNTINSEIVISKADAFPSDQENIYIFEGNETPMHVKSEEQVSANVFNSEDNHSVVSVNSNNDYQYSNVSSPSNDFTTTNIDYEAQVRLGIETPEDSNSLPGIEMDNSRTSLILQIPAINANNVLPTPDVLDNILYLEEDNLFVDFLNAQVATTINSEDFQLSEPSTSDNIDVKKEPSEDLDEDISPKRKRKSRLDDDDEDYLPPSKRSKRISRYEDDDEFELPSPKRGRPARRASSVSSDHSDASKYRELRDKNNEASRKSRLKRKVKEKTLEKEAEELEEQNIKLTTQVEELQKMVDSFKNNLFRIMTKK